MADDPNRQPDNTEWCLVIHRRMPVPRDEVMGHYPTANDATLALNAVLQHPEWFATYSIEHRNKA